MGRKFRLLILSFGILLGLSLPNRASAQGCSPTEGEPVIYGSSQCSGAKFGSTAYIDASAFAAANNYDLCATINSILFSSTYPSTVGAVIDARGLIQKSGPTLTCGSNPFNLPKGKTYPPSTILLPGTSIQISDMWTVPSNTRIIGDTPAPQSESTLQVASGFSGTAMIQMCPPLSGTCTGISIEHLTLNGQYSGGTVPFPAYGIQNLGAQDQSYVDDVNLQNFGQAGIFVTSGGQGSGPYSHINFGAWSTCSTNTTTGCACAVLQAQTRGLARPFLMSSDAAAPSLSRSLRQGGDFDLPS